MLQLNEVINKINVDADILKLYFYSELTAKSYPKLHCENSDRNLDNKAHYLCEPFPLTALQFVGEKRQGVKWNQCVEYGVQVNGSI